MSQEYTKLSEKRCQAINTVLKSYLCELGGKAHESIIYTEWKEVCTPDVSGLWATFMFFMFFCIFTFFYSMSVLFGGSFFL